MTGEQKSPGGSGLSLVLTAHPLQRVGAFALAALATPRGPRRRAPHPEELDGQQIRAVNDAMTADLEQTIRVANGQEAGGFWLGVSNMLWPNSRIVPTSRKKMTPEERLEAIREWRRIPESEEPVQARCMLCDRAACGYFGKSTIPLAQSHSHRNTTLPGHPGIALCRGCLLCFYALPYGCDVSGGKATALHSWDEAFLAKATSRQVRRTKQMGHLASQKRHSVDYAMHLQALDRLAAYEDRITDGVELYVFTNANRGQELQVHAMEQPMAAWISTAPPRHLPLLARAHRTDKRPGRGELAHTLFDRPHFLVSTATAYARAGAQTYGFPTRLTPELAPVCRSYAKEVLMVADSDLERIDRLSRRIAQILAKHPDNTEFKKFTVAMRKQRDLKGWLRRQALHEALTSEEPLVDTRQWRLLFDSDLEGFLHRDLMLISTLEHLHTLAPSWRTEAAEELDEDDAFPTDDEDEENDQ